MKILFWGSGPAWTWARTVLDRASVVSTVKPEIILFDGLSPHDFLASLTVGSMDLLVFVEQEPFANEGVPPDVPADDVRNEAQKAILALELARRIPRTLILSPTEIAQWPQLIADLLGVSPDDIGQLEKPVLMDGTPQGTEGSSSLLQTYLAPLFAATAHPTHVVVTWSRDCFLYGDAPGETLPATIEVAGRARILAYGPYMPLPKGHWQAKAFLGFSPDIGSLPFILEADTDAGITRGFFEVKQGGIFTLDLDFEVFDPFHPVEFRLVSQDSAIEGLASLIEIRLEQLSA